MLIYLHIIYITRIGQTITPYTARVSAIFALDTIPEMDYHQSIRPIKP
ncbi:hypothetical protein Aazo_3632 ['Nostoc azollae' 0708]|jgi:hypothetical protein|uniref:Uncharacterized protein n=1 Tax=Nostoc azollae (strain 0708) TaxID=551115 RepID=D7E3N9_NOSA0|nr:hypothetical protein Aazo_3632 ['Nostoc azollae' 0708]